MDEHKKLSYTAAPVVYGRMFSDIPYSKEIAQICDVEATVNDAYRETNRLISPYIEARFKALSNLLKQSGIKNIIEVASGLSQRGLIMSEDKAINYVETDLPEMLKEKEGIMRMLTGQKGRQFPSNLHFLSLNVLDEENFKSVVSSLPSGPIAIGHEGLLAHLTREERGKMGKIIKNILSERGGVWITPDIFTSEQLAGLLSGKKRKVTEDVVKNTGRNYNDNAFRSVEDAQEFFSSLGFEYKIKTLGETAGELASIKIGLDEHSIKDQLALNIWELTVPTKAS